jgi:hypothetical protein
MNGGRILPMILLCSAIAPSVHGSPAAVATKNVDSPGLVVEAFYKDTTVNRQQPKKWFEPKLAELLAADRRRAGRAQEICGFLDFDPFIDAQDDVGTAKVGHVSVSGTQARVEVSFSEASDHRVIVVLHRSKAGWRIANIIYPREKEENLVELLEAAAKEKCDE